MIRVHTIVKEGPVGKVEREVADEVGKFLNEPAHKPVSISHAVAISTSGIIYSALIVYEDEAE